MVQLMPLPAIVSCFSKIQNVLPFWCRLTQVAVKRMCVTNCWKQSLIWILQFAVELLRFFYWQAAAVCTVDGEVLQVPRFIHDTSKYWHKPHITREEGICWIDLYLHFWSIVWNFVFL